MPTLVRALASLSLLRFNAGHGVDDALLQRLVGLEQRDGSLEVTRSPRFDVAEQLVWVGRHDEARPLLEGLRDELRSREDIEESSALWYLAFVELMAGRWTLAAEYSERCGLLVEQAGFDANPAVLWCRADGQCASWGSRPRTAVRDAYGRRGGADWRASVRRERPRCPRVPCFVARQRPRGTQPAWDLAGNLGAQRVIWSQECGSLRLTMPRPASPHGDLAAAEAALEPWEELARTLERPHVLAQAARCRALMAAADGDLDDAFAQIEQALADHARVRLPFHEARTYLALGSIERRARHKRDARAALERALAEFEQLPAPLWAERARDELARVSGRAPSRGKLTPTERRVAELVAEGLATKEVAARLFVSPRTVDGHLTHIYAKLGVHSRTDLARRLAQGADTPVA